MLLWSSCDVVVGFWTTSTSLSCYSPSFSSRTAYVLQWHLHSRAVVFRTLHRGQIDTRLCPLISYILLICTYCGFSVPRVLLNFPFFTLLPHPLLPPMLLLNAPPLCEAPPVPTTASILAPLVPFPTPHTGQQ